MQFENWYADEFEVSLTTNQEMPKALINMDPVVTADHSTKDAGDPTP